MKSYCDMKGFLTFLILRMISKNDLSGEEIRQELARRKGCKPSPGTVYPVLKYLNENELIKGLNSKGKLKKYHITKFGEKELKLATKKFVSIFCDMKEEF